MDTLTRRISARTLVREVEAIASQFEALGRLDHSSEHFQGRSTAFADAAADLRKALAVSVVSEIEEAA